MLDVWNRRRFLGASAALALAGCASRPATPKHHPVAASAPPASGQARPVPALKPGATIAIVAPASAADNAAAEAAQWLQDRGFQTLDMSGQRMDIPYDYLAGPDSYRLAQLQNAFAMPEIGAVWCLQGGFGSWRLLDQLDYASMARHPKPFIGYSDITALHLALQRRAGFVTFHGPMLGQDFLLGRQEPTEMLAWAMLMGRMGQGSWITAPASGSLIELSPGVASGRLIGGNLALIAALMGGPDEIDTQDAILFIEDVNEPPPRVDRLLSQLVRAGKLDGVKAVLVGNFTRGQPGDASSQSLYLPIVREALAGLNVPVLAGWPSGHWDPNLMLPLGARVTLDTSRGLRLDQAVVV